MTMFFQSPHSYYKSEETHDPFLMDSSGFKKIFKFLPENFELSPWLDYLKKLKLTKSAELTKQQAIFDDTCFANLKCMETLNPKLSQSKLTTHLMKKISRELDKLKQRFPENKRFDERLSFYLGTKFKDDVTVEHPIRQFSENTSIRKIFNALINEYLENLKKLEIVKEKKKILYDQLQISCKVEPKVYEDTSKSSPLSKCSNKEKTYYQCLLEEQLLEINLMNAEENIEFLIFKEKVNAYKKIFTKLKSEVEVLISTLDPTSSKKTQKEALAVGRLAMCLEDCIQNMEDVLDTYRNERVEPLDTTSIFDLTAPLVKTQNFSLALENVFDMFFDFQNIFVRNLFPKELSFGVEKKEKQKKDEEQEQEKEEKKKEEEEEEEEEEGEGEGEEEEQEEDYLPKDFIAPKLLLTLERNLSDPECKLSNEKAKFASVLLSPAGGLKKCLVVYKNQADKSTFLKELLCAWYAAFPQGSVRNIFVAALTQNSYDTWTDIIMKSQEIFSSPFFRCIKGQVKEGIAMHESKSSIAEQVSSELFKLTHDKNIVNKVQTLVFNGSLEDARIDQDTFDSLRDIYQGEWDNISPSSDKETKEYAERNSLFIIDDLIASGSQEFDIDEYFKNEDDEENEEESEMILSENSDASEEDHEDDDETEEGDESSDLDFDPADVWLDVYSSCKSPLIALIQENTLQEMSETTLTALAKFFTVSGTCGKDKEQLKTEELSMLEKIKKAISKPSSRAFNNVFAGRILFLGGCDPNPKEENEVHVPNALLKALEHISLEKLLYFTFANGIHKSPVVMIRKHPSLSVSHINKLLQRNHIGLQTYNLMTEEDEIYMIATAFFDNPEKNKGEQQTKKRISLLLKNSHKTLGNTSLTKRQKSVIDNVVSNIDLSESKQTKYFNNSPYVITRIFDPNDQSLITSIYIAQGYVPSLEELKKLQSLHFNVLKYLFKHF
jgi:hypothetical protein